MHWFNMAKVTNLKKGERGIGFVELIIVVALAGMVGAAITAAAFQTLTFTTRLSNQMTAIRQVQQAGFWVSPDVMMANPAKSNFNPGGGKFLVLAWTDANGNDHEVTYTITSERRLQRTHKVTPHEGEATTEVSVVAQYVDTSFDPSTGKPKTYCAWDGKVFTLVVTATVGNQTETRTYQVQPRVGT